MKDKIGPFYSELRGYISQAPEATSGRERIYNDTSLVDQLNSSIQELEHVSQKLILRTGKDTGLTLNDIFKLFS